MTVNQQAGEKKKSEAGRQPSVLSGQRSAARGGHREPRPGRGERPKPEFDQKILHIRRVARVVKGGRRFSFSVVLVAGNRHGKVGVGVGKSADVAGAVEKAFRDAKRRMVELRLSPEGSLPHEVRANYCGAKILIKPAPGRGVAAGSSARVILNLAGAKAVTAKVLSKTKNKLNIARATMAALAQL